jgi:hypothetical protein
MGSDPDLLPDAAHTVKGKGMLFLLGILAVVL